MTAPAVYQDVRVRISLEGIMLYSRSAQYAIRAMAHLATLPPGNYRRVRDVARDTRVPEPFLAKIMQMLARHGLVRSQKGRGGGVALARSPRRVTVDDIVHAVDGQDPGEECLLGLAHCSDAAPCIVHAVWKSLRAELDRTLHERTLADVVEHSVQRRVHKRRPG
jgi:Rrf2 family protein